MNQEQSTTSPFERFLYALIGVATAVVALVAVLVATLGEWVILALALFAAGAFGWFIVWLFSGWLTWLWSKIGDKREDWADRRLNREILAATTRQQLLLTDKQSNLVYAQDGFMPVAYSQVMDGTNNSRLLELAAQRIETLKPVENVPNHLHIVTSNETDQTLNAGAGVPNVTGNLGGLSFLTPGSQAKYKVLDTEENDQDDEQQ